MSQGGLRPSTHSPPSAPPPSRWSSEGDGPNLSLAWISRPRVGELENGDAVFVRRHGASVLVAVIDALGHGPRAAEVASTSVDWLGTADHGTDTTALVMGLHRQLAGSRGIAGLILLVSPSGLEACSVGNIELRSTTSRFPFVLTPGVLGVRLRQPKVCASTSNVPDRYVIHSDGISGRFDIRELRDQPPADLASSIFARYRHDHDDATVVVLDVG